MVRAKDPLWVHVDQPKEKKLGAGFVCKFCGEEFSGGATRIKFHLSKETGGDIKSCTKVPQHVSLEATELIRDRRETKKLKTDTQVKIGGSNTRHVNQVDQSLVNAKLAKFLLLNNIPFDVVETPSFKEFAESFETDYELPSLSMLTRHEREAIAQYTKDIEECLVETGCTLIANRVRHSDAMVIYLWTPKGLLFKDKFQYTTEHGSADGLFKEKLSSTVEFLGPTHIVQFTCDDLYYYHTTLEEVYSQCHTSESIVNCAFTMITIVIHDIRDIISNLNVTNCASMIFLYINNNSSINLTLGKEHERGKESDVSSSKFVIRENWWMSSKGLANLVIIFWRLKSVLASQDAVISQLSEQSSEAKYARLVYLAIHCEEFWSGAKTLVKVLEPLLEALCLLACQGGTIGYLSQAIHRARDELEEYKRVEDKYRIRLFENLYLTRPIHEAATILDPAYMLEKKLEGKNIYNRWCHYFDNLVQDSDKKCFKNEFRAYCSENSNIFTPSALDKLRTLHPGKWWELFGHSVPVLQKYALWIVIQPCTSFFFTDDELRSIIEDESEGGQFRSRKLIICRSSELKATRYDDILNEAYEFALREGTNLPGYKSLEDQISRFDEGFWNASSNPNFQLLKWHLFRF